MIGTIWISSSRILVRLLGLCSTFILARLLMPEDYGLVAIVTGIYGFLESFSELGFNQALIQFKNVDDDCYSTVWSLNICRGLLISIILVIIAYPTSIVLSDKRLFLLILYIAILPIIKGAANPRIIEFEKNLKFDVIFKIMLITKVISVIITIGIVIIWRSYWVLIHGMLIADITYCCLTYYYAPFKIRLTMTSWRKLVNFSGWISGSQILRALAQRLDPVILARFATPNIVGLLHMSRELSNMTFLEVAAPVRRVIYPALSKYALNSPEFIDIYKQSLKSLFMVLAPICMVFTFTVPDFVPLILGDKWNDVIKPIQYIMIFLTVSIIGQLAQSASFARGHSKPVFMQAAILTPIKLVIYIICVWKYSFYGAIYSICIDLVLTTLTDLYISQLATGIKYMAHFRLIRQCIYSLALMVIFMIITKQLLDCISMNNHIVRISMQILISGIIYTSATIILWKAAGCPDGIEKRIIQVSKKIIKNI